MNAVATIKHSLLQLFYPHVCAGCGSDSLPAGSEICLKCIHHLPRTDFEKHPDNPVEKGFIGRLNISRASAMYYFHKVTSLQNILHALKYQGNTDLGRQLGLLLGNALKNSGRFDDIDVLIPMPLHISRLKSRGYNQAEVICNGIATTLHIPVVSDAVIRVVATETQTHKARLERYENMKDKFRLKNDANIRNKNILLVDDVITTGATLESCGATLLQAAGTTLSIATVAYASKI